MNNNDYVTKFANSLKALRSRLLMSQSDIAKMLEIPTSTYANWEQGRRQPSIHDIYKLIEIFEIDANELFDL